MIKISLAKIASLFVLVFTIFTTSLVHAQTLIGKNYYVSTTGSDSNGGTQSAPFKTFTKAVSVLSVGDTLYISAGTYTTPLIINKSGTAGSPIKVKSQGNGSVIIDVNRTTNTSITISGSYVEVIGPGIKAAGSKWAGVDVTGQYVTIDSLDVTTARSHGIIVKGAYDTIKNSNIYENVQENNPVLVSNQWGSGLKVERGATNTLLEGNNVYQNYGEGIAITMGKTALVRNNKAYDNYSANFYIDNSSNVTINGNLGYCTGNPLFARNGSPASAFLIGEEAGSPWYDGWGPQLINLTITNNISNGCSYFGYWGSDQPTNGGLKGAIIANNTVLNVYNGKSAFYIGSSPANSNIKIINNIATGAISNGTGITVSNNVFSVSFATTPNPSNPTTFTPATTATNIIDKATANGLTSDYFGRARPSGSAPDIGAIEVGSSSTVIASSTPIATPTRKIGDANGDNLINEPDFSIWKNSYLVKPSSMGSDFGDFDNNNLVDGVDYMLWVNNYGK